MSRIAGVQYLALCDITSGAGSSVTYGEPVEIKQFISFSATKNFSETSWYSNDVTEEIFQGVVDVDLEIVVGRLSGDLKAKIMGHTYDAEKGVITEKADDEQPEFGLIVVLTQLPSGKLCQAYTRVKLKVESVNGETKTDSITDSQVTISGKAIADANGVICHTLDSNDTDADETTVNNWKTAFYTGASN